MDERETGVEDRRGLPAQLRIVRGDPTAAELAAVASVIAARAQATATHEQGPGTQRARAASSRWADRSRQLRRTLPRGTDAWRAAVR